MRKRHVALPSLLQASHLPDLLCMAYGHLSGEEQTTCKALQGTTRLTRLPNLDWIRWRKRHISHLFLTREDLPSEAHVDEALSGWNGPPLTLSTRSLGTFQHRRGAVIDVGPIGHHNDGRFWAGQDQVLGGHPGLAQARPHLQATII